MVKVLVPLADGVEELEAVTIIDVLRRGGVDVAGAAIGKETRVEGSRGVIFLADGLWQNLDSETFDAIVLPGGGQGTENLAADERVLDAIRAFNDAGKLVAAVCAGPTVLEAAGVLEGHKATCYPSCAKILGPEYENVPVVADGNIITSQGPGTAMMFALVVLSHLVGEETARRVATGLLAPQF